MIINLKQTEIVAALKLYISQQGINLTNKEIQVSFTAGRKDTGLSAELTIEDGAGYVEIPGFTEPEFEAPVLTIVPNIAPVADEDVKVFPVTEAVVADAAELVDIQESMTAEADKIAGVPEAVKTTSLFA